MLSAARATGSFGTPDHQSRSQRSRSTAVSVHAPTDPPPAPGAAPAPAPAPASPSSLAPPPSTVGRSSTLAQLDGQHFRRTKIVKEIQDTENSYVEGLKVLIKVFLNPLNEALANKKPIISQQDVRSMFSFVEVIVRINDEFLQSLNQRIATWNEGSLVGDVFLNLCKMLPMYSEYINNYNNAIETMSRCLEESEEFRDFLQQGRNDPETRGLDVTSFMILPIQRVPRYQLLLEDLLRRTDESHPDHGNISQAVVAIKGTAEFLNEAKRQSENLLKVVSIQQRLINFPGTLLEAGRSYVLEGSALLMTSRGSKYIYMFLFSDIIVLALKKSKSTKYKVLDVITLLTIRILNIPDTEELKNAFRIIGSKVSGESIEHTVYSNDLEDKVKWLKILKDVIHTRKKNEFDMKAARSGHKGDV